MNPALITAIAYLIAETLSAGVEITALLAEVKATGKVSPERWAAIIAEIDNAEAAWKASS